MMNRTVLIFGLIFLLCIKTVQAQSLAIVRDEEIERTLSFYTKPLFKAAKLNQNDLKIHLVNDNSMNAFATSGLNIFVHTGLLLKADNAQEIIAVLAHETGHIAGGHIVRLHDNLKISQRGMLVSMILGAIAVAAGGGGDVAMGAMMGGMSSSQSLFAAYRRSEENAADSTAITLLSKTGHDFSGLKSIMKKLKKQDEYLHSNPMPLLQSHPDTKERLEFILGQKETIEINLSPNLKMIEQENKAFKRIQAKLFGFLSSPTKTLKRYKGKNFADRYAQSIAFYQNRDFDKSFNTIDELILENPTDPYLYELKGQFLFETGKPEQASEDYKKAVQLLPDSLLFRIGLIQSLVAIDNKDSLLLAKKELSYFPTSLNKNPELWRLQSIVYGKLGYTFQATYSLAEFNFLIGDYKQAYFFAKKALSIKSDLSPITLQLEDILNLSKKYNKSRQ